jgi:hypothetical protein
MSALETKKAESAQAVFCAMADYIGRSRAREVMIEEAMTTNPRGRKQFEYFTDFLKRELKVRGAETMTGEKFLSKCWKERTKTPGCTLQEVKQLLTGKDKTSWEWYQSSCYIAVDLVEKLATKVDPDFRISQAGFQNLYYFRTDPEIMDKIDKIFAITKNAGIYKDRNQIPFGDINKWSPADIYLANEGAKKALSNFLKKYQNSKDLTFVTLNTFIREQINKGNLLPLSLKKADKTVALYKINFDRNLEVRNMNQLKVKSIGSNMSSAYRKWTAQNKQALALNIYLGGAPGFINIRHDVSGNNFLSEYSPPGKARGGKVGGTSQWIKAFEWVDPTFARSLDTKMRPSLNKFKAALKDPNYKPFHQEDMPFKPKSTSGTKSYIGAKGIESFRNERNFRIAFPRRKYDKDVYKDWFDKERRYLSATLVTNIVLDEVNTWFKKGDNAERYTRVIYEYATSRSSSSSPFVISK